MKSWEFTKVENNRIRIDDWLADSMGIVDGGYVYSTLFKYPGSGPKRYELILSMYPQENFRTLAQVTVYAEDIPGSTVQASRFLSDRQIRVLNSVSLTGISDTTIVWNILADLNFAGEGELIEEKFQEMKAAGDPRVDKIKYVSIKPAQIGRIFKSGDESSLKTELRHGAPITFEDGAFDLSKEYGDILDDVDGSEVMITLDPTSWLVSVVFFKKQTDLVRIEMHVPDCLGSIDSALSILAECGINLISVFTKVMIAYQTMDIEVVADLKDSTVSESQLSEILPQHLGKQNGVFELKAIQRLRMRIGAFTRTTLSEWRGMDCCWIGVRGSDVSCPYWGHAELSAADGPEVDPEEILSYISERGKTLDGIVVGGGEPLASRDLYPFLKELRRSKRPVALQTYGTRPDELDDIAGAMMVDRVELFVPTLDPERLAKAEPGASIDTLLRTIEVMRNLDADVAYTTVAVPGILDGIGAEAIAKAVADSGPITIMAFDPSRCRSPELAKVRPYSRAEAAEIKDAARRRAKHVSLAGFRPRLRKSETETLDTGSRVRELRFTKTVASPADFFIAEMSDWSVDITPTDSPHSVSSISVAASSAVAKVLTMRTGADGSMRASSSSGGIPTKIAGV